MPVGDVKKLGNVFTLQRGFDITKSAQSDGVYPVVSSSGINSYHNEYKVNGPGVVIGRKGTLGTAFYLEGKFWPHDTSLWIKDFKGNDPKFLYYFLKALPLEKLDSGSANPTLNRNFVHLIESIIPEPDIQIGIAGILWSLDKKIELNNKINAELESMAKLIYDYWFVQFDFPDSNGKPYKSSGGKMVYNETLKREIPDGWKAKRISEIEPNIVTGKTPSTDKPEFFNGEVPFICIGDVRGNMHVTSTELTLSEAGACSQEKKYIPEGAICVTCIASPGLVGFASEDSQTNQQLNSIICRDFENRYFLFFYLQDYFKFAKAKSGNTFANMNKGDFSSIESVHPDQQILEKFSELLKPLIEKNLLNSKENNRLAELRDWLLPMLMNGQVTVKDS